MWLASLIAQTVAKEWTKWKEKQKRKGCWGHVFWVVLLTFINSFVFGDGSRNDVAPKHVARPMSAPRLHTPGCLSTQVLATKTPRSNTEPRGTPPRRQHRSGLGPDESIRLSALDRPAGTLARVREDKVGGPWPTAPACLHFPWQCMTVCVLVRGSLRPCNHTWNPRYQERVMGPWTLRHSETFGLFFFACVCVWLI